MQFFVDNCSLYNTESLRFLAKFTCILLKDLLKWKKSRYLSIGGLNSASYIKDSENWYIAEQQNPLILSFWEEPKNQHGIFNQGPHPGCLGREDLGF